MFNENPKRLNNIKNIFTIKDLENISGIKAHTIRIWEKRYNLLEPNRTDTNIRYYSSNSLLKLLNVILLKKNGYKISKIGEMSEELILSHSRNLACKYAINNEAVNALKMAMFQFNKVLFNNTYNNLLLQKNFKQIFTEVFIPLLNEIGLLWQTSTLLPAHEHFISNLIMQKIQTNTEILESTAVNKDYTYVLFLPEGEIHEIGLLYLNYELVLRGCQTIYLGQSLPLSNLDYFFDGDLKVCFITSITVKPYEDKVLDFLKEIDEVLENTEHKMLAVGNKAMNFISHNFKSNIKLYPCLSGVIADFNNIN